MLEQKDYEIFREIMKEVIAPIHNDIEELKGMDKAILDELENKIA